MSVREEWVRLYELDGTFGREGMAVLRAALRCRRVVRVRESADRKLWCEARVPLPRAVERMVRDIEEVLEPQERGA